MFFLPKQLQTESQLILVYLFLKLSRFDRLNRAKKKKGSRIEKLRSFIVQQKSQ